MHSRYRLQVENATGRPTELTPPARLAFRRNRLRLLPWPNGVEARVTDQVAPAVLVHQLDLAASLKQVTAATMAAIEANRASDLKRADRPAEDHAQTTGVAQRHFRIPIISGGESECCGRFHTVKWPQAPNLPAAIGYLLAPEQRCRHPMSVILGNDGSVEDAARALACYGKRFG